MSLWRSALLALPLAVSKQICAKPGDDIYNPTLFDSVPAVCCDGKKPGVARQHLVCPCELAGEGHAYFLQNAGSELFLHETADGKLGLTTKEAEALRWTIIAHEPGFAIKNLATGHYIAEDATPIDATNHRVVASQRGPMDDCREAHCDVKPMGSLWFLGFVTELDVPLTSPGIPCVNHQFTLVNFLGSSLYELRNSSHEVGIVSALLQEFEYNHVPVGQAELRWTFIPVDASAEGMLAAKIAVGPLPPALLALVAFLVTSVLGLVWVARKRAVRPPPPLLG